MLSACTLSASFFQLSTTLIIFLLVFRLLLINDEDTDMHLDLLLTIAGNNNDPFHSLAIL